MLIQPERIVSLGLEATKYRPTKSVQVIRLLDWIDRSTGTVSYRKADGSVGELTLGTVCCFGKYIAMDTPKDNVLVIVDGMVDIVESECFYQNHSLVVGGTTAPVDYEEEPFMM